MNKVSVLNYAFALGKIRALEKFLIQQEVFQEAIESDILQALRLFVEASLYGDELLHIQESWQLEAFLDQELLKLKNSVSNLLLDKVLLGLLESDTLESWEVVLREYPSLFLEDYFRHLTDMHNIKSFLRLYVLEEPKEKLKEVLVYEGFIKKKIFLELYEQDLTQFLNRLEYVHKREQIISYASFLETAIRNLESQNSFVALEKAIQGFLMEVLKPAKYISFGPEPILAYYFGKRNEINLMRMIILAKLNDVSADLLKQRLNTVYA